MNADEFAGRGDDPMRGVQLLMFDLDCLLADPRPLRIHALASALLQLTAEGDRRLDIPDNTSLELLSSRIEAHMDLLAPNLDKQGMIRLLELVQDYKTKAVQEGRVELQADILEAMEELREMGYLLAIQSPDDRNYMLAVIDYFELDRYIDISVCESDVGREYGELRFLEIIEKEELLTSEVAFISHRGSELEVAHRMGMTTIGVLWEGGDADEFRSADRLVESPADLVGLLSDIERDS
jgi:phosphoglycolate phosphatase-like HAD superfamily hydrolase